ncbi:MAG: low molecular weight phosphotyrosine protein phosphatase [Gammaproteobacteria bacterium]|nr:low molecular weight phosphotyrosine protein phosphatase [Gammaproteobacteria bacterium]
MEKIKVLMVCMGNICRSPLAQGVFERRVEEAGLAHRIVTDSAGTHAYHVGNLPDPRSQQTALRHGIDLSAQRAREVAAVDFEAFDYLLAMDNDNHALLSARCPEEHLHKLRLFLEFAPQLAATEVPDPYYGGDSGFEQVYQLIDAAADGLLAAIKARHLSRVVTR